MQHVVAMHYNLRPLLEGELESRLMKCQCKMVRLERRSCSFFVIGLILFLEV